MQMETPFFIVIMDDFKFRQEKSPNLSTRAFFESGAGKETRTPDPNLGKVMLYQLSYSRLLSSFY